MIKPIKNLIREIKYAYQRVIRGYDERIKWEFDSYFSQFIPPLKEFCEEELKKMGNLNFVGSEKRKEIYKTTLDLIYAFDNMPGEDQWQDGNATDKMWEYIGRHLKWYWN